MSTNQYAVFQLKPDPALRPYHYKSYQKLMDEHLFIDSDNYRQVYLAALIQDKSPEEIRRQLEKKLPPKFMGSKINVSDVLAVKKDSVSRAYYVDSNALVPIPGFFKIVPPAASSATLITMDSSSVPLEGRKGNWMATDDVIVDGKQFFLMVSVDYGRNAAYAVVDAQGKKAAEDTVKGFDEQTIQQIRKYMETPALPEKLLGQPHGRPMEIWQKSYENGEYLRSVESGIEANYSLIDGTNNNPKKQQQTEEVKKSKSQPERAPAGGKKKRPSVLKRLKEKQEIVAARYGKAAPEQEKDDMERNRK